MTATIPFQRAKAGPQLGVPPSLEQIHVDRLQIDEAYQRATDSPRSRQIIVSMVKAWDWTLCQPLVVARRPDGALFILDGQHRHAGARERGDIPFLPCVVLSSLDHAGEARTFVKLNTERQKLTQAEVFHGQLAAGDPHARAVLELLEATDWKVRRGSNTAVYRPGDLECAPMMVKVLAVRGEAPVRFGLTVLRAAYPSKPVRCAATLLKALFDVFGMMEEAEFNVEQLVAAIGGVEPNDWITRGLILREQHPTWSQTFAVARAMTAIASGEDVPLTRPVRAIAPPSSADPLPAARVQAPPATAPASQSPNNQPSPQLRRAPATPAGAPVFGSSGKGWCDQCDQLRSREAARACGDRFCKLRAHA